MKLKWPIPVIVAYIRKQNATIHHRPISGMMNLNHFLYGTAAKARQDMVIPLAGVTALVNASPNWKANTAVCLVTPTRSARGAMIGMVIAAWPEPEGTRILNRSCTINMPKAVRERREVVQNPCKGMYDGIHDTCIGQENGGCLTEAHHQAGEHHALASPETKLSAISRAFRPPMTPVTIPMMRNKAEISSM